MPDSDVLLGHLVVALMSEEGHEAVAQSLLPIARRNPGIVRLNMIAAEALAETGRTGEAITLLENCGEAVEWQDGDLVRRIVAYYWQEGRRDDLRALLDSLLEKRSIRTSFVGQFVAAMFYRSLLEDPAATGQEADADAAEKRKERTRRAMLHHATRAVDLLQDFDRERDIRQLADLLEAYEAWRPLADLLGRALSLPELSTIPLRLLYAQSLAETDRERHARRVLDDVYADPNLSLRALANVARLYVAAGDVEAGILVYEGMLSDTPAPRALIGGLGFLYLRAGREEDAVRLIQSLERPGARELLILAHAHHMLGRHDEAFETLQRVMALREQEPDFGWDDRQFLLFAGTVADESGHTELALQWAEKAHRAEPDEPVVCNFLGYLLADHNRRLDEAERLIRKAVEADPENVAYLDSLAWVLYRRGHSWRALEQIFRALRIQEGPDDGVILDHAGDVCRACGLPVLARQYWTEALVSPQIRNHSKKREAVERKLGAAASPEPQHGSPSR